MNHKPLILGLTLIGLLNISFAFSIGIKPVVIDMEMKPGETRVQSIILESKQSEQTEAKLYLGPINIDGTGRAVPDYQDGLLQLYDCRSWISVEPVNFMIIPGKTITIRMEITVPQQTPAGDYYCYFFVEEVPPPQPEMGISVRVVTRVAGKIVLRIVDPGQKKPLREDAIQFSNLKYKLTEDYLLIECEFKNESLYGQSASANVVLRKADRSVVATYRLTGERGDALYPKTTSLLRKQIELNTLADGKYIAEVSLDYLGPEILVGEKDILLSRMLLISKVKKSSYKANSPIYFKANISNTGTVPLPVKGEIIIADLRGNVIGNTYPISYQHVISAGQDIEVPFTWSGDKLAPGNYKFVIRIFVPDAEPLVWEEPLQVR